ncbi:MAG: GNAT family N-acetyltransferase [Candidatus Baltobacteraceae bacterium]
MRVEPIAPATQEPALQYLARAPYVNVFITHAVLHATALPARSRIAVALEAGEVRGVAYSGRQLALAAEPSSLPAFAEHAKRHRSERMIIGERDTIRAFWELIAGWHEPPRVVRDRQFVMMIDRRRLRRQGGAASVRHARIGECAAVTQSSVEMIRQELAYDPSRSTADFAASVRQMIERKLWWVGIAEDRLCFFCNIGPWCRETIQLQGIWTPPDLRGRGLATSALAAICDRLLEVSPTLSLYVNDFNEPAIALYRRVGFEHVADFQTLLF